MALSDSSVTRPWSFFTVSPTATTPGLTEDGKNPLFFRTVANDNAQAALTSDFMLKKLKVKKVAYLHDNGDYGKGFADNNRAILEKAGIKDARFTLDVENKAPYITIAQSMQASFAQGGVKIDLLPAAGSQVYARVRAKQHQAAIRLWIPDYFDAHSNASAFAYNDGKSSTVAGLNGWQIPALNKATLAAVAEPDPAKRLKLYQQMQEELQRSSPYVFVDQGKTQIVVRDNVKGYQQGLNADMVYYDRVTK